MTQLHPSMGVAVLKHLEQFAPVLSLVADEGSYRDGFIAGQAVASAVSELFLDGACVAYNDIDLFRFSSMYEENKRKALTTLSFEVFEEEMHYGQCSIAANTVYTVMRTAREGLLNEVVCYCPYLHYSYPSGLEFDLTTPLNQQLPYMVERERLAQDFLKSFDLNCVQVAVRLSDRKLIWSPAFAQFLTNREMLVMNAKTPVHTAVRWLRKKQELAGVFGHDERAMELLAAAAGRYKTRLHEFEGDLGYRYAQSLRAQISFGKLYKAKAEAVYSDLRKYFGIERLHDRKAELYTLTPVGNVNQALLSTNCPDLLLPTFARAVQGVWRRSVCEKVVAALDPGVSSLLAQSVAIEGIDVLKKLRTAEDARLLALLDTDHPGLQRHIYNMDMQQRLMLAKALRNLALKEGQWVYGVFEHLAPSPELAEATTDAKMAQTAATLFQAELERFDKLRAEAKEHSFEVVAPIQWDRFVVRELDTAVQLFEEGERMHHCVGGYLGKVLDGRCRIFSFSSHRVQDSLTVELGRGSYSKSSTEWVVYQNHGLQNRGATDEEERIVDSFVLALNLQAQLKTLLRMSLKLEQTLKFVQAQPRLCRFLIKVTPEAAKNYLVQKQRAIAWTWQQQVHRVKNIFSKEKSGTGTYRTAPNFSNMDDDIPF